MSKIDLNILPFLSQEQRRALKEGKGRKPGVIADASRALIEAGLARMEINQRESGFDPEAERRKVMAALLVRRAEAEYAPGQMRRYDASSDPPPPDFSSWPEDRRNAWFAERAREYGKEHPNVTPIRAKKRDSDGPIDDRIADLFAEEWRDRLRFVAAWGKWLEWRDGCWREEATHKVFDLIRKTCKAHGIENARMAKMTADVHFLARADRRLAATADQWDADPWLLNTPDGMVDLRTGALRKHDPLAYCTKITAAGVRGDCPMWMAFLRRVTGGNEELIAYLQRTFGYCLTGDTSEQAVFFAHGVGANGKTVLVATVSGILGDYAQTTPIETFTESRIDRHPTELARMRGARLVTATETEAGRYWAESRLKEITGGERIAARFMHKDFFEYLPQFKPWISGNHKPRLRSVGEAMRRRVNMIPFLVIIPEDERDHQLAAKLEAEWPGILAWMIDGCLDWQERGSLGAPEAVTNATNAYFAGEDGYADWIADRCDIVRGQWARSSKLFASWKDWAEKAGQHAGDNKRFREEMERLGYPHKHDKTGNFFVGLCIRQDPPEDNPQEYNPFD
jgi:putative DNA primase/helicase